MCELSEQFPNTERFSRSYWEKTPLPRREETKVGHGIWQTGTQRREVRGSPGPQHHSGAATQRAHTTVVGGEGGVCWEGCQRGRELSLGTRICTNSMEAPFTPKCRKGQSWNTKQRKSVAAPHSKPNKKLYKTGKRATWFSCE